MLYKEINSTRAANIGAVIARGTGDISKNIKTSKQHKPQNEHIPNETLNFSVSFAEGFESLQNDCYKALVLKSGHQY